MGTVTRSLELQPVDVRRLLLIQLAIVVAAALVALAGWGAEAAAGTAFGGAVASLSAWMLGRRVRWASELARTSPGQETGVLYVGAVERFVVVLVLFALAMGTLGLPAVPVLAGFGLAQLAYFLGGARARPGVDTAASSVEKWG